MGFTVGYVRQPVFQRGEYAASSIFLDVYLADLERRAEPRVLTTTRYFKYSIPLFA